MDTEYVQKISFEPNQLENRAIPPIILATFGVCVFWMVVFLIYMIFHVSVPKPFAPREDDKTYRAIYSDGIAYRDITPQSWFEEWKRIRVEAKENGKAHPYYPKGQIDKGDILLSVVVPAYNEEDRLPKMLEDVISYMKDKYEDLHQIVAKSRGDSVPHGWEIVVVSDGSKDNTVKAALEVARKHKIYDDISIEEQGEKYRTLRVISFSRNRGKGGAVRHGLKFVRGQYALFADADGASPFYNISSLLASCVKKQATDVEGRAFIVGSRAHLVNSEPVVKRSFVRNLLMKSFHMILRELTPPETASIKDTQCGFKLLSRPALPSIVPHIHFEGWIFDVEMLMLAEGAGIPMEEIPVNEWTEVQGSKLNVLFDSFEMAWNLIVLRVVWMLGITSAR